MTLSTILRARNVLLRRGRAARARDRLADHGQHGGADRCHDDDRDGVRDVERDDVVVHTAFPT